jgi:hypothetical protein
MGDGLEKKYAWSNKITLITGNKDRTDRLQADFSEPGSYTVQFSVSAPGPVRCQAYVDWSIAGQTVRRFVDIVDGTTLTGGGQGIAVRVVDATPAGETQGVEYTVIATCRMGVRGSYQLPPTLFGQHYNLLPDAPQVLAIPASSGAISIEVVPSILADGDPVPTILVELLSAGSATVYKSFMAQAGFIALPPNCSQVKLTNKNATTSASATVTFGIEG